MILLRPSIWMYVWGFPLLLVSLRDCSLAWGLLFILWLSICMFIYRHLLYYCTVVRVRTDTTYQLNIWTKYLSSHYNYITCTNPASMAQLDAPSDWRSGGRGFNPRRGRQYFFVEIDHEIFSTVILSLPLIQEGQLSVSGERMCTILINRLEDQACPVNMCLGKLSALEMTTLGRLGRKTSTQTQNLHKVKKKSRC